MKIGKQTVVRIVKRQKDEPAPEKRMAEVDPQGTSLSKVKKTVISWVKEFRNKPLVELQPEFSDLFRVMRVSDGSGASLRLSRQLVRKKKLRE